MKTLPANVVGFNYQTLAPATAQTLQAEAQAIQRLTSRIAKDTVEAGRRLAAIREVMPAPEFYAWAASELQFSLRTTQTLMRIARRFGQLDCLEYFHQSALELLANEKIGDAARDEAISMARSQQKVTFYTAQEIVNRHHPHPTIPIVPKDFDRMRSSMVRVVKTWPADKRDKLPELLTRLVEEILAEHMPEPTAEAIGIMATA